MVIIKYISIERGLQFSLFHSGPALQEKQVKNRIGNKDLDPQPIFAWHFIPSVQAHRDLVISKAQVFLNREAA